MTDAALAVLQRRLGYAFQNRDFLVQALTHRSAGGAHYERLEYLGDGLLNFAIGEAAFNLWPKSNEGDLSRLRSSLVCEETLARVAQPLALQDLLRMGPGELKSGGYRRESIHADVLEALLGAIYLDGGFVPAREVVLKLYAGEFSRLPAPETLKDAKTRLQEWLQAIPRPLPEYRVLAENGPAHRRVFEVACRLPDSGCETRAGGSSRKHAEQDAARLMFQRLQQQENQHA